MKIFLFLDFDGTLAPIASTPGKAALPPAARLVLKRLLRRPLFKVAIVSGRVIKDLRAKIGLKGLIYAGNHGYEIAGPGLSAPVKVPQKTIRLLSRIHARLREEFSDAPEIMIEDKKTTIGFHYRLVGKKHVERMKKRFKAVVKPFLGKNAVAIQAGKMVFEVRPPVEWNKGKTVNYILGKHPGKDILPVFIGDDITDETAFRALRGKGITIHVGSNRKTAACFTLKDTGAVLAFLKKLERLGRE